MNYQNSRFVITLATAVDSREIAEVLEEEAFPGNFRIKFTRHPDAWASLQKEGDEVHTLICREKKTNVLVAMGSIAFRFCYINGSTEKIAYLFNLRSRYEYRNVFPLLQGYTISKKILKETELLITTILNDNFHAKKLLEKKRKNMPDYISLGKYNVYALKPSRKTKLPNGFFLNRAKESDTNELLEFLEKEGSKYQFYPVLKKENLLIKKPGSLNVKDFFLLQNSDGDILGVTAVWQQKEYKQYLLESYSGLFRLVAPLSRGLKFLGFPTLPKAPAYLDFFTFSFWAVKNKETRLFKMLLNEVAKINNKFSFILIGMHQKNPFNNELNSFKKWHYGSELYLVDWNKEGKAVKRLNHEQIPYLECGML